MSEIRIELNRAGVRELLQSKEMADILQGHAEAYAAKMGAGWATDTKLMPTRVIASAYTTTNEAAKEAMTDNYGLKVLGGGAL